jgi:hypothetical protein
LRAGRIEPYSGPTAYVAAITAAIFASTLGARADLLKYALPGHAKIYISATNQLATIFSVNKQNNGPLSWFKRNSQFNKGATGKSFREDFRGTCVFVQGIPPDTTSQTLKDHFHTAGTVVFALVSQHAEMTNQSATAIQIMRGNPLNGNTPYVRADVQEPKSAQTLRPKPKKKIAAATRTVFSCGFVFRPNT